MNLQVSEPPHRTVISIHERPRIPIWKRAIDIACCLVALPVLCLVTVVMAVILKLTAPGPVLFKQERVGYKGSRFKCYKFRTMVTGADTAGHQAYYRNLVGSQAPMVKLDAKGDKRLIPGGWILRATGLDELPQIINIFLGEMSIVGPRPCLQYEYDEYEPWHRERFNSLPGLTGLWQVSGKNRTTFEQMVHLDIEYSKTRSLHLDVKIILMTVPKRLLMQVTDTHKARRKPGKNLNGAQPFLNGRKFQTQPSNSRGPGL